MDIETKSRVNSADYEGAEDFGRGKVCREQDLKQSEVEGWIDIFVKSGEQGLKTNRKDQQAQHDRELKELRAKVGELVLELDARKKLQALTGERETNY